MQPSNSFDDEQTTITWPVIALVLAGTLTGVLVAYIVLSSWVPGLTNTLVGTQPKGFWYLSRASALIAYFLLWLSMIFGLVITNRMAKIWPGGPTAFTVHEFFSLLGLGMAGFHALILMGDRFINVSLTQLLVPFAVTSYKPLWVGIGQLALIIWAVVLFSFYVRKNIGNRAWRLIHFASFLTFLMALVHGLLAGSDNGNPWVAGMYWFTGLVFLFFLFYRILASKAGNATRAEAPRSRVPVKAVQTVRIEEK